MEQREEMDHFKVLEEKVETLIVHITSLRDEKESLKKKIHEQERSIAELAGELKNLKESRDKAKDRIVSILTKIEQLDA
ncbi:cell division protein ZapB [Thermodesulfobacteriota bacterium]